MHVSSPRDADTTPYGRTMTAPYAPWEGARPTTTTKTTTLTCREPSSDDGYASPDLLSSDTSSSSIAHAPRTAHCRPLGARDVIADVIADVTRNARHASSDGNRLPADVARSDDVMTHARHHAGCERRPRRQADSGSSGHESVESKLKHLLLAEPEPSDDTAIHIYDDVPDDDSDRTGPREEGLQQASSCRDRCGDVDDEDTTSRLHAGGWSGPLPSYEQACRRPNLDGSQNRTVSFGNGDDIVAAAVDRQRCLRQCGGAHAAHPANTRLLSRDEFPAYRGLPYPAANTLNEAPLLAQNHAFEPGRSWGVHMPGVDGGYSNSGTQIDLTRAAPFAIDGSELDSADGSQSDRRQHDVTPASLLRQHDVTPTSLAQRCKAPKSILRSRKKHTVRFELEPRVIRETDEGNCAPASDDCRVVHSTCEASGETAGDPDQANDLNARLEAPADARLAEAKVEAWLRHKHTATAADVCRRAPTAAEDVTDACRRWPTTAEDVAVDFSATEDDAGCYIDAAKTRRVLKAISHLRQQQTSGGQEVTGRAPPAGHNEPGRHGAGMSAVCRTGAQPGEAMARCPGAVRVTPGPYEPCLPAGYVRLSYSSLACGQPCGSGAEAGPSSSGHHPTTARGRAALGPVSESYKGGAEAGSIAEGHHPTTARGGAAFGPVSEGRHPNTANPEWYIKSASSADMLDLLQSNRTCNLP